MAATVVTPSDRHPLKRESGGLPDCGDWVEYAATTLDAGSGNGNMQTEENGTENF